MTMQGSVRLGACLLLAVVVALPAAAGDALQFKAELSGAEEVPPVVTDTTGEVELEVNADRTEIKFELEAENAVSIFAVAGAHIHCGATGINGPVVLFLTGAVPGGFDGEVETEATLTQKNVANTTTSCGATLADIVDAMLDGNMYANYHSTAHPGGEVRGQIVLDDDEDMDDHHIQETEALSSHKPEGKTKAQLR